jgi:exosortase A-associated hydrolase 1
MNFDDIAFRFTCHGDWLYGVLSMPEQPRSRGVLMLVGGPQYRVGSHRQFTLLARYLASCGIPVMRFDYRGMGDSEGDWRNFENVDDDVRCAVDHFIQSVPGMTDLVIWGLCDAASAALFYAYRDSRVTGLVLLNPWVRTEKGLAKTYLKHYYFSRLFDSELWTKILTGSFNYTDAGRSLLTAIRAACGRVGRQENFFDSDVASEAASLPDRMLEGYSRFKGRVLLILSDNDLTAKEFSDLAASSDKWRGLLEDPRTLRYALPGANHTFSTRDWRNQVGSWTREWVESW